MRLWNILEGFGNEKKSEGFVVIIFFFVSCIFES